MTGSSSLAMKRYSVQPREKLFVKGYWFLSLARNIGRFIGKNISKNLSSKYSQNLLDLATQSGTHAFKSATKMAFQKTADTTGDLIRNKTTDRITKVSKTSLKNNSEEEILRERFIPSELRQKFINDLKLKEKKYWLF